MNNAPLQEETRGSMCGGLMSYSEWIKDPSANMMAYHMDDEEFEVYVKLMAGGGKADRKSAEKWFELWTKVFAYLDPSGGIILGGHNPAG